eukprot:GHVU01091653.1.p1 GENE.GHVU01091653.1~~GHVU01091653.1.p1  ORF type:complete len:101 (-),score=3.47 GHVU01091653.1:34-336(-)
MLEPMRLPEEIDSVLQPFLVNPFRVSFLRSSSSKNPCLLEGILLVPCARALGCFGYLLRVFDQMVLLDIYPVPNEFIVVGCNTNRQIVSCFGGAKAQEQA